MDDQISALLAETHNSLRTQLHAAERDFDRLRQLLETRESRDIARLNHAARRLRASGGNWGHALVEACDGFCARAALFTLRGGHLHLEKSSCGATLEDLPLEAAPAFRAAVETKDTVVAVQSRGEMSAAIAACFGEAVAGKFRLFPISAGGRVAALLYADGAANLQPDALELLAAIAGMVLESRPETARESLVTIEAPSAGGEPDQHRKARRFARVQVAEIRLYQDQHVKNGRAGRDLYASLKTQIDSARAAYRSEFMGGSQPMTDYLHQELVHTLAHGDVELLGPTYPGPMA